MAKKGTVFANGRSIVHKGDGGKNTCPQPDVCLTPSGSSMVPVPYVNTAFDSDLTNGSTSVEIEGQPVALRNSYLCKSTGDEAGTGGGLISGINKGKMTWISASPNVFIEGQPVVRYQDACLHNGNSSNSCGAMQPGTGAPSIMETEPDRIIEPILKDDPRSETIRVLVYESIYPGKPSNREPLRKKWLYVFCDGALAVKVYAEGPTNWQVDSKQLSQSKTSTDQTIDLLRGPAGKEKKYVMLVSAVELTDSALDYFREHIGKCSELPAFDVASRVRRVYARDPWRWAADVHNDWFWVRLNEWRDWVGNENRAAELYIASTLQCLIGKDDPLGLSNEFEAPPERYLERYKQKELEKRYQAELAYAEVGAWVDSVSWRTLERAAMERGGRDLELCCQAWGAIAPGMTETLPGQTFSRRVALSAERFPGRYLFTTNPPPNAIDFERVRYVWLAGASVFKELAPAYMTVLKVQGFEPLKEMARYLERLGAKNPSVGLRKLTGVERQIYRNAVAGRSLMSGANSARVTQRAIRAIKTEMGFAEIAKRGEQVAMLHDYHTMFRGKFEGMTLTFTAVVEIVNLSSALIELREQSKGETVLQLIAVAGAAADLAKIIGESMQFLQLTERILGTAKSANIFAIVSGVCDAIGFGAHAVSAAEQYEYGQMAGYALAATGAGLSAIGGGIGLALSQGWIAPTAATTTAAPIILVVGAALAGTGVVLANALTKNTYENFARFSFLGDRRTDDPLESPNFPWATCALPNPKPDQRREEAKCLRVLLANFGLSVHDDRGCWITPGLGLEDDVFFELYIEEHYQRFAPNVARVRVDWAAREIVQVAGLRPLLPGSYFERDFDGRVTRIYICCQEEPPADTLLASSSRLVRARLHLGPGLSLPMKGKKAPNKPVELEDGLWLEAWTRWSGLSLADPPDTVHSINEPAMVNQEKVTFRATPALEVKNLR